MPALTDHQRSIIQSLVDSAPDKVVRDLNMALSADPAPDGAMAQIGVMVAEEAAERAARNMVFEPVLGLVRIVGADAARRPYPVAIVALLWRALRQTEPALIAAALEPLQSLEPDIEPLDALCRAAAAGLRDATGTPFAPAASLLEQVEHDGAENFAKVLDLAPLTRSVMPKLPEWLGRLTDERAIAAKLAYRDAVAIDPDGGPRFLEILASQLDEPWMLLRVLSAVMDHPTDTYLAGSELSHFGERLLAEIDRAIELVNAFEPNQGLDAGRVAGQAVAHAIVLIAELEQSLNLTRDGPWSQRVSNQRRVLAQKTESLMSKADDAAAAALPLKQTRFAGRMRRGAPTLTQPPDPRAIDRALGAAGFIEANRNGAQGGGYASTRAKVIEKLEERIDSYVEEAIDLMREDEALAENARAYLEVAAGLIGLIRDEKAAQIVRRRVAAA